MDNADRDIEKAEEDAVRGEGSSHLQPIRTAPAPQRPGKQRLLTAERRDQLSRTVTMTSSSSSGSDSSDSDDSSFTSPADADADRNDIEHAPTQHESGRSLERNETALSRIATQRTQHGGTVGATVTSRQSKKPLPSFGGGKPYPPMLPEQEEYVVEFDGQDDPLHAQNWPMKKKLTVAIMLGYATFVASFGSSIFSAATTPVSLQFGVSTEVGILGTSLYVLGFATGPIIWAPFSELYGRRLPIVISMFGFTIFSFAVAVGKDLQTVLICRFWNGFFGACPLTVVAAVFSDMFGNRTRGIAVTAFSIAVFSGPMLAPFIGGFTVINPHLGWRWTEYIVGILGALAFALVALFLEETYPPSLLANKAAELRRRTKNWGIHAKQEEVEIDLRELLEKNLSRPLRMLFTEPIVLLITVYMSFIYGLLYLLLTAYPIIFQKLHGFNPGVGGLPFFGVIGGELLAGLFILLRQPSYTRKLKANNGQSVPEWRLPEVIVGGVVFTVGLFWLGWAGYKPDTHWIAPTLSGLCTGFGIMAIFLQSLNYLVDAYLMFAASAIAANTFLRSICGAVFPLFATYMFDALKVNWSLTLLGCVAAILVPVPVIFWLKGATIRQKSKFAPTPKLADD